MVHPDSKRETLSAPGIGLGTDHREAPRVNGSRRHVLGTCPGRCNADYEFTWRVEKDKMEMAPEELGQSLSGAQDRCR